MLVLAVCLVLTRGSVDVHQRLHAVYLKGCSHYAQIRACARSVNVVVSFNEFHYNGHARAQCELPFRSAIRVVQSAENFCQQNVAVDLCDQRFRSAV